MGDDGKFYRFEQQTIADEEPKRRGGCTRERIIWAVVVVALVAAIIGVLVHFVPKDKDNEDTISDLKAQIAKAPGTTTNSSAAPTTATTPATTTPNITDAMKRRIDCIPEAKGKYANATVELCDRRGCVYDDTGVKDVPVCYHGNERGYRVTGYSETQLGFRLVLESKGRGPFGNDIKSAVFDVEMRSENTIRFKFDDPEFNRYKVPLKTNMPSKKSNSTAYSIKITNNQTFAFQIIRKSTGRVLWDTGVGSLVLSDQFLQISTKLPSINVYGFGENTHPHLRHNLDFTSWPMFARSDYTGDMTDTNLYGVHPFYECVEGDGNTHGVFLLNSNAMDYSFTPLPMLTYRSIGGILDFYMFLGPTPENVVQQYTGLIGRPYMPPYWALGFQLCRYGYRDLQHLKEVVERTKAHNIPHDVQYVDIDYMDGYKDFTVDNTNFNGLAEYFSTLRAGGMRTVVIVDPPITINVTGYTPYDRLTQVEGAVKWPVDYSAPAGDRDSTNAMLGYGRPDGKTVYPDFLNNRTTEVWQELIVKHRKEIPFDGLWIDMNEPENFGTNEEKPWNWPESAKPYWSLHCPTNNRYEEPPYRTKAGYVHDTPDRLARLSDKTLCMVGRQGSSGEYRHYDVHSLYGWSQAPPTMAGLRRATGERGFVLSRSTFPGSGRHASHWLGDNRSDWPNMKNSIIGMLEFNMFGIPHVGADICGYQGDSMAELCKRWMQLGAFYPLSRQHNGKQNIDQDPGHFGAEVASAAREALETRYLLLPYLYTLFHKAHTEGGTVARPMFHEFANDPLSHTTYIQFLWGSNLMIVPVLKQNASSVLFYKPADVMWYNFYTGVKDLQDDFVSWAFLDSQSRIPLFVREGAILPLQRPANNTHFSRQNPMKLLVAMSKNNTATGELFWDDGVSIDTYENGIYFLAKFMADEYSISMVIEHDGYDMTSLHIDEIQIYGASGEIKRVIYNRQSLTYNLNIDTSDNFPKSVLTITNITIPMSKEFTVYLSNDDSDDTKNLDCYPEAQGGVEQVTKATCEARGCIYKLATIGPMCYFNLNNYGYRVVDNKMDTNLGFTYKLEHKGTPNPYSHTGSKDIQNLNFVVEMRGNDVLRIKLEDANSKRFEVPVTLNLASRKATNPRYEVKVTSNDPFSFQVIRRSSGEILWDTGVGGLTFSDQFLQISTALPSNYIYGFGENVHHSFKHDLTFRTWPMWSRDQPVGWGANLNHYGVHPFYTCMEDGGHSHGVLLLNSNAQDYSFTPLPMLTYRTIGGVLDFYMFLGPEPENVVQQYTGMVGRPYMPPYWSLGFQLCRYGYNSLDNLRAAAERTITAKIPYDIQYADIDHMDERRDFTIDPVNFAGLEDYFTSLKSRGMHTIIILDPALISNNTGYEPYERMRDTNSNIKWPATSAHIPHDSSTANNDLLGYVWPKGKSVFPDFFKDSTKTVWRELIKNHHSSLTFDGLWIDMNEPASFGTNEERPFNWPEKDKPYWSLNCTLEGSTIEHPPYRTMAAFAHDDKDKGRKAMLSDKTVCLRAVQGDGGKYRHYDVHSLYGWSQTQPTLEGLREATGERGIVISRSTFPGSGQYAGHWLGDNDSKWEEMRLSIIGMLEFNLFGIPYIGADICGFFGNTTVELCKRWMQLGAFYTFSRNHNGNGFNEQDPAVLGYEVEKASKVALETRYRLLPYLYTLFHNAHVRGNTVIRPLHHVFPYDVTAYQIDEQFMWGSALLISPILYQGQTSLSVYLPQGPWYDFYTGKETPVHGSYMTIPVDADSQIPLHVHAGHILPLQASANNTHYSRQNPFTLLVALEDSQNGGRGFRATGELYWDDGVTIDTFEKGQYHHATFRSDHDTLSMTVEHSNETTISSLYIDSIIVMGVGTNVEHVYIGDKEHTNVTYDKNLKVLTLGGLVLPMDQNFALEWREFQRPSATDLQRFDCFPDIDEREDAEAQPECQRRGCIYTPLPDKPYVPKCYIDKNQHGYLIQNKSIDSAFLRKKSTKSLFGMDISTLKVTVDRWSNEMLRVKIFDPAHTRYEVPVDLNMPTRSYNDSTALYDVEIADKNQDFHVKVTRKSTNTKIFDTSIGHLIFSDQYLQISTGLASDNFYGLGEHRHFHLKHNLDYKTWPIFTRDANVNSPDYTNLYGAHPFYMNLEDDKGNAHAVLLLNSNAMEVLLEPQPRVTFRTIGGLLDFYIFLGPEPETVIQQYTQVIGPPVMVPYWSLGFQLCRWGYNSLDNMKAAVERTKQAGIPHDVQYGDIDYMDERKDFTYDQVAFSGFPDYVRELQAGGMHFIVIVDPGIISNESNYHPYDEGVKQDVFVKWPAGKGDALSKTPENYMLGYVWPKGKVAFPDFLNLNATTDYWINQTVQFHKTVNFDGLWIDMNEPANFDTNGERPWNWPEKDKPYWTLKCTLDNNTWDIPPYKPRSVLGDKLSEKTLCMSGVQNDGMYRHYDVHSLYGMSQAKPTMLGVHQATGKRGLVLSRSTYPTSGRTATHWLGDNGSFWRNLHDSIIGIIEFNLFGIPYVGADICGFDQEGEMEMCQRWMQLGAFYTFSRNHNAKDKPDQDPAIFGKHVGDSSRQAFETRYSLLPYLYTQFYRVHATGGTIIRSMMHEFPTDKRTWEVDTQFMWAKALLIAPVLEQGHFKKDVYLPDARWFDFYTGDELMSRQTLVNVDAPRDYVPLFVRGGYIVPMQDPANNTHFSRQNPMKLLVALGDDGTAQGDLFWDDGDSIDTYETGNYFHAMFKANEYSVAMTIDHNGFEMSSLKINQIKIYGMSSGIKRVVFDGIHATFDLDTEQNDQNPRSVLTISDISIPLDRDFTVFMSNDDSDETKHLDCYPEVQGGVEQVTKATCEARGCIYNKAVTIGPICYFNLANYGYKIVGNKMDTDLGFTYKLMHKGIPNPYSNTGSKDIQNLNFVVEMRGNDVLRIKLTDANSTRYEVPTTLHLASNKAINPRYEVKVTSNDPFSFQVIRRSSGEILWDTGVGGLTFSDQFLQISTALPSNYIYGFGENVHHSFKHDLTFRMWPMWSRDQPVGWGTNLNHYGVHPFYTCMEKGGHSHGVLLLNSNAQDYSFTPLPMLTYRTIGGVLDFYMFLGPEPENVIQQYTGVIGRPYMPPYWSLGFQLCRYGYNSLDKLKDAAERTINAKIPYDIQYADIDHMDERRDFTIDPVNFAGLDDYFTSLKSGGMRTIIILDPALISNNTGYEPFERMRDTNSNIKWPAIGANIPLDSSTANNDLLGYVWPKGKSVFPDFFKDSTKTVWKELIKNHYSNLTFDGLWIDMNEPASFGTNEERPFNWPENDKPYWSLNCTLNGSTIEHPPYRTKAAYVHDGNGRKAMLSDKTVCLRAVQGDGGKYRHYDVHSLYGWSQTPPTLEGLREATGERGIVISRSTFPGSGQYAGHWLGDNDSKWEEMRLSIIGILEFNLFGIPYIGADICGFFGDTTVELCKRWMQLGAFYTFSRNHNGLGNIPQDPAALGDDVATASKFAMETRYRLLPYLYTLFHNAHLKGNTVIRPLHHVFPYDESTYQIDQQFMWGPALLISPILYEGQSSLSMYLPQGPWYDFYNGHEMPAQQSYITLPVGPDSPIPLHVRAGHILPIQAPANNTHYSRQNPFTLMVALEDSHNGGRGFRATGELYWDDGVTIDSYEKGQYHRATFQSGHDTLSMTIEHSNDTTISSLHIDSIMVMGVRTNVQHVYSGDTKLTKFLYDKDSKVLHIAGLQLPMNKDMSLEWREFQRPQLADLDRFDCYPDIDDTSDTAAKPECERRECIFAPDPTKPYLPKCYIDKSKHGYTVQAKTGDTAILTRKGTGVIFPPDISKLKVQVMKRSNTVLQVKITDNSASRYEVPVDFNLPQNGHDDMNSMYDVEMSDNNQDFYVKVTRRHTNSVIFDTSIGPLIFSDQYLQISSGLASDNFYGLGEHRHFHLKHNLDYRTWPIFTRDASVNYPDYTNLYGAHPFYMNLDDEANAHAVLLLNSNAMEVLLEPQPRVTFRTIGGVLDFYIFLGPEPETVIQQYTSVIGPPVMVPYWSLGFQLSRWGYNALDNMKAAVDRTRAAGIPHDVQFADIDALDERKDFTVGFPGLPEYVKELQAGGMHFIVIVDPGIISNNTDYTPFVEGYNNDAFIKWPPGKGDELSKTKGDDMLGYVWPKGKVVFPDFLKINLTTDYWIDQIKEYHKILTFDGLWIDMNEPANFDTNGERPWNWPEKDKPYWTLKCTLDNNTWDIPPYKPRSVLGDVLSEKTLCMNGIQNDGMYRHYDVHSLYGMSQAKPTMLGVQQATGKRGLVLSRSTYPTAGRTATHWLGDNDSFWRNLHDSIIGIIEFNLFGIPYIGADICGFFAEPTEEMCQRWMQLGAFYTFSRNHNGQGMKEQDPGVFGKHVADSSRQAFEIRYSLLPYLYTQFYLVHGKGGTIIRSMMHEFPKDKRTRTIDTQFMWAHGLLIAPVLEPNHFEKDVYFPDARWFDYYTGKECTSRKTLVRVDAPRDFIPLFLRGGYIIPTQEPANNTVYSRRNPLGLLIVPDDNGNAEGDLFWDDGDSIVTTAKGGRFYCTFTSNSSSVSTKIYLSDAVVDDLKFDTVWVYGVPVSPATVAITTNGQHRTDSTFTYFTDTKLLKIQNIGAPLKNEFTLSWH